MTSGFYLVVVTAAIKTLVRIVILGVNASVFKNEIEGVVHKTAVAALVVFQVAVNQLLL